MRIRFLLFPLLLLFLGMMAARAQTPTLVADIMPGGGGSDPDGYVVFNSKLYFVATTSTAGTELWSYDGVNPPRLVYDLNPGAADGTLKGLVSGLVVFKNKLYFCGNNGALGFELFSYDGINPPVLVTDLRSGADSSYLTPYTVFDNKLVCTGSTTANGNELYLYDGVNAPVLYDINPGAGSSNLNFFCAFNGKLYFSAYSGTNIGTELFGYDPATNRVSLMADINSGTNNGYPSGMMVLGGKMYFSATTAANGRELFSYDGANIALTNDLTPGSGNGLYYRMFPYNGKIYMSGATDGQNYQLYAYNPSNGSTTLVHAFSTTGRFPPHPAITYKGKLYMWAFTPTSGYEIWSTDGTTTTMLPEIAAGATGGTFNLSVIPFIQYNDALYFTAGDPVANGSELYRINIPTSVQSVRFDGSVAVYPNPATHTASLELSLQSPRTVRVLLTDAVGRAVYESVQVGCPAGKTVLPIPMEALASGIYLYRVQDAKDDLLQSGQIEKQ